MTTRQLPGFLMANGQLPAVSKNGFRTCRLAIDYFTTTQTTTQKHKKEKLMPKYQKFQELPVWQESARLYNRVLALPEEPGVPLSPGFRNQLDRAALSVSNNIAEGF